MTYVRIERISVHPTISSQKLNQFGVIWETMSIVFLFSLIWAMPSLSFILMMFSWSFIIVMVSLSLLFMVISLSSSTTSSVWATLFPTASLHEITDWENLVQAHKLAKSHISFDSKDILHHTVLISSMVLLIMMVLMVLNWFMEQRSHHVHIWLLSFCTLCIRLY